MGHFQALKRLPTPYSLQIGRFDTIKRPADAYSYEESPKSRPRVAQESPKSRPRVAQESHSSRGGRCRHAVEDR